MTNTANIENYSIISIGHAMNVNNYQDRFTMDLHEKYIDGEAPINALTDPNHTWQAQVSVFIHIADVWPDMQSTGQQQQHNLKEMREIC